MTNPDRILEDVPVGEVSIDGPIVVTEHEIIAFGRAYDPQPFHIDPVAAATGPFGSLIASGWHIAALVMKQIVQSRPYGATPIIGMGVDELRWLRPVRPGDGLMVRREVVSSRVSAHRPDHGVLKTRGEVTNQAGVMVLSFVTVTQMPTRENHQTG